MTEPRGSSSVSGAPSEGEADWGPLSALPGNPLMWVLILSEMLVFAAAFGLFAWMRADQRELFDASQQLLDPVIGGLNTMVLLTSGLFAALATNAVARHQVRRSRQWLLLTMALGLVFGAIKIAEYASKFGAGLTPETNTFFAFYYLLTGFHFAHVLFGLVLLALVAWRTTLANVETATAFWHMVDLIWILLYPLIYLLR
ncbi:nitric oxide reductase NorE protein [Modicisalibacter ilicicola DSM 19980]|uniref:Nitric oxide reductase NorE protein n=1 Tax=Modicisalibacter ilicicola DSM 19980 TaxID=1121942 RepID=A0A1M4SNE1_9GAMM|nr:cytochrome c oxidase subunit 3 family protein [Halomonas ilicicola]SHE33698.1 nitric oxide reductase NorE protein [Halomonas ilicicola DSM 19980]